jgi:Family of unknown function (DUF6498)
MEPAPANLRSPEALAALIAVNITPLAGIVFLGWLPSAVLISYFVDTFIGFGVVMLLIMVHVTGDNEAGPIVGWKRWTKALVALAVLGAIFAFPLAFPIFFLYADDRETLALLRDTNFLLALAVQVLMSALAAVRMHRVLQATHDDEKILAARTLFLAARWFALFVAMVTGFIGMLGPRIGGFLLVAVYAGASIYFELHPERAARWLRGKNAKPIEFQGDLDSRLAGKQRKR